VPEKMSKRGIRGRNQGNVHKDCARGRAGQHEMQKAGGQAAVLEIHGGPDLFCLRNTHITMPFRRYIFNLTSQTA
jgi:hypothetical protein